MFSLIRGHIRSEKMMPVATKQPSFSQLTMSTAVLYFFLPVKPIHYCISRHSYHLQPIAHSVLSLQFTVSCVVKGLVTAQSDGVL